MGASDPSEAIDPVAEQGAWEIHLLLTDVVMPRMSGWDLARQARRVLPGIRVLYTSGYTEAARAKVRVHDPNALFTERPFTTAQLARQVRTAPGGVAENV